MRRAVVVPMDEFAPFCWLVSVDDTTNAFVVVDPQEIFSDYQPATDGSKALSIVKISSDWRKTTVNLRAPIMIDTTSRNGVQLVLGESSYGLAEPIYQD